MPKVILGVGRILMSEVPLDACTSQYGWTCLNGKEMARGVCNWAIGGLYFLFRALWFGVGVQSGREACTPALNLNPIARKDAFEVYLMPAERVSDRNRCRAGAKPASVLAFGLGFPPTLTNRAISRSQYLGFALWQSGFCALPQGKSEILRSTICSIREGWWPRG